MKTAAPTADGTEAEVSSTAPAEHGWTFPSLAKTPTTVLGKDHKFRPAWVADDPTLTEYYDLEWSDPITDEGQLFELLCLLTFQAGLRWKSILLRRAALKAALADFSIDTLAGWGEEHVAGLLLDPSVIRNRRKIEAIIVNAKAALQLREGGGLAHLVWSHQPDTTPVPVFPKDVPDSIPEAAELAKAMKKLGFVAVGPKSCFALMQAAGVVDANPLGSYKRGLSGLWDEDGNQVARPMLPSNLGSYPWTL